MPTLRCMDHTQSKQTVSFLPLEPAAMKLGLPVAYLRRLADEGVVPCLRIGRRRLFNCDDVAAVLRGNCVERGAAR